ncbi:MAG: tetratricopeptide repeat protein [Planctomycetota bacterium]
MESPLPGPATVKPAVKHPATSATTPTAARSPEQLLSYAEWLLGEEPEKALLHFDRFIKQHPNHLFLPEAHFGRGKALYGLGRLEESFSTIEESFPPTPEIHALAMRCGYELMIGNRLLSRGQSKTKEQKKSEKKGGRSLKASRVFSAILYNDPNGIHAPAALLGLGQAELLLNHQPQKALKAFLRLIHGHPQSELCAEAKVYACTALLNEIQASGSSDATKVLQIEKLAGEAGEIRFQKRPGLTRELATVQNRLKEVKADRLLAQSRFYSRQKGDQGKRSALYLYLKILEKYPKSKAAKQAKAGLAEMGEAVPGETK